MILNRMLRTCVLVGLVSFNASAGFLKVGEMLLSESGIKQIIKKGGATGADMTALKVAMQNGVNGISGDKGFYTSLKTLYVGTEDRALKSKVLRLMNKKPSELQSDEAIELYNGIVDLSTKYAINADVMSCSLCISEQASLLGFKAAVSKVVDPGIKKVLKRVPTKPRSLRLFIKQRARAAGVKDSFNYLSKEDSRALGVFLELKRRGTKEYKDFYKAMMKFNKLEDGSVVLSGPEAPSLLWRALSKKSNKRRIVKMTKIMNEVASSSPKERKSAFYKALYKEAGDSPQKQKVVKKIEEKNCLFN